MLHKTITVKLQFKIHPQLQFHFEDRLKYLDSSISSIKFISTQLIEIVFEASGNESIIIDKVQEAINLAAQNEVDFIEEKVLFDNTKANYEPRDCTSELIKKGFIKYSKHGFYSFFGPAKKLLDTLDNWFYDIAENMQCKDISLPAVISTDDLMTAGHFESFPHHIYLVNNLDLTAKKTINVTDSKESIVFKNNSTHSEVCLVPSVCYNYFRLLKNHTFKTLEESLVTARCKCYRYELSDVAPFRRQKEFDMREVVFIGEPVNVDNTRMKLIQMTWDIIKEFDLKARVVNASDPFFLDNITARTAVQFNREMKYELQAFYTEDASVASSSFNLHSSSFVKAFNIKSDIPNTVSGCVGWGLERWALVLFSKFSTNPSKWPSKLQHIFNNRKIL